MAAAVYMRREGAPLFCDLAPLRQRKHLEPAAVGEYGTVPAGETVQAARLAQGLQTRPQIQVVGIAQDYLGPHILLQIFMINALDAAHGADRHKDGGLYAAVVGGQHTAAGT